MAIFTHNHTWIGEIEMRSVLVALLLMTDVGHGCLDSPEFRPEDATGSNSADLGDTADSAARDGLQTSETGLGAETGAPDVLLCEVTMPSREVCDGIDNDCNGTVDEGLSKPCALQTGVCEGTVRTCTNGKFPDCTSSTFGQEFEKQEKSCDNLDNDCDTRIDEHSNCRFSKLLGSTGFDSTGESIIDPETGDLIFSGGVQNEFRGNDPGLPVGDSFLARVNPSGRITWVTIVGDGTREAVKDIEIDPDTGSIFITGSTAGSLRDNPHIGQDDAFVMKLSSGGREEWAVQLGSTKSDRFVDIEFDDDSELLAAGTFRGNFSNAVHFGDGDILLAQLSRDGKVRWKTSHGSTEREAVVGLVEGENDNNRVVGVTDGDLVTNPNERRTFFNARVKDNGQLGDLEKWTTTGNVEFFGTAVLQSNAGGIYLGGKRVRNGTQDIFLGQFIDGQFKDFQTWDFGEADSIADLELERNSDHVWIAGHTKGSPPGVKPHGGRDVFVFRYDGVSSGPKGLYWKGTTNKELAGSLALDPKSDIAYFTGVSAGDLFGQMNSGGDDIFVTRIR